VTQTSKREVCCHSTVPVLRGYHAHCSDHFSSAPAPVPQSVSHALSPTVTHTGSEGADSRIWTHSVRNLEFGLCLDFGISEFRNFGISEFRNFGIWTLWTFGLLDTLNFVWTLEFGLWGGLCLDFGGLWNFWTLDFGIWNLNLVNLNLPIYPVDLCARFAILRFCDFAILLCKL